MASNFFDKLKKSIVSGAAHSAAKVEEAARIGKIRLDIMNEKRNLNAKFAELGELAYKAVQQDQWAQVAEEPVFTELLGEISLKQRDINALKSKLTESSSPEAEVESQGSAN
jgi:hypothetical protein